MKFLLILGILLAKRLLSLEDCILCQDFKTFKLSILKCFFKGAADVKLLLTHLDDLFFVSRVVRRIKTVLDRIQIVIVVTIHIIC